MSAETDISQAIANISAIIKDITANPKPNYTVDGQTVNWSDYLDTLTTKLSSLLKTQQLLGGPFQRMTRMKPR
jgi:ABC-type glycerol-3-phosphate transport system substrate-binding protein